MYDDRPDYNNVEERIPTLETREYTQIEQLMIKEVYQPLTSEEKLVLSEYRKSFKRKKRGKQK